MDHFPRPYYGPEEKLYKENLPPLPHALLQAWIQEAVDNKVPEANAMLLATATAAGRPSCRTVLLKRFDEKGLVFFTNYDSRKGKEIEENPLAAATLFWPAMMKQIRVEGSVVKTDRSISEAYFATRPRRSRLSAWASKQDQPIDSREKLEEAFAEAENRFEGKEVPLPPYWGGYLIKPETYEFWEGKPDRLHDRFLYRQAKEKWELTRLSP